MRLRLSKREFWTKVLLVFVPYVFAGIMGGLLNEPKPHFWTMHAILVSGLVLFFIILWFIAVKEKRNEQT